MTTFYTYLQPTPIRITGWLLVFLGLQIGAAMLFVFWPWPDKERLDALKDLLTVTLGPTVALLGSAIGFYFGRRGAD